MDWKRRIVDVVWDVKLVDYLDLTGDDLDSAICKNLLYLLNIRTKNIILLHFKFKYFLIK